jgi:parallel beta-helix repeat protein
MEGIEILNNTFSNNGDDGNVSKTPASVIRLYYLGRVVSYSGAPTSKVSGNTFSNNYGYGILAGGTSDLTVSNNRMTSALGSRNPSLAPPANWYHAAFINVFGVCGGSTCTASDRISSRTTTSPGSLRPQTRGKSRAYASMPARDLPASLSATM